MKKALICAASLGALIDLAGAADLPKPVAGAALSPTPQHWTGLYIGLNAGGAWARNSNVSAGSVPLYSYPLFDQYGNVFVPGTNSGALGLTGLLSAHQSGGFIGGGQLGYNFKFSNNTLIGFETDLQGLTANNSSGPTQLTTVIADTKLQDGSDNYSVVTSAMSASKSITYLGTVRGRLGYLVTPDLLVYGTGGFAYGGTKLSFYGLQEHSTQSIEIGPGLISNARTSVGWTAGGGIEWAFAQNWSAKVEYLYYDLGGFVTSGGGFTSRVWAPGPYTIPGLPFGQLLGLTQTRIDSKSFDGNVVRAGINYHFNFGALPSL